VAFRAVIFDLGGVVMPSPIDAFREYERNAGLPHRFISEVIVSGDESSAWARLERGELTLESFGMAFEEECAARGEQVRAADLLGALSGGGEVRRPMLDAIAAIRAAGLKAAALTNNWVSDDRVAISERMPALATTFDLVIESSIVGLRKPDPRIYELVCNKLGVAPHESVFLDDLGVNLKPARALGMPTIKVADPAEALAELERTLGFALDGADR
jgi:putative hydrolase of the HAD superfamily